MKVYSLNKSAIAPCLVVKTKELTIMLDCALDLSSILHFLPGVPVNSKRWSSAKQWTCSDVKQQLGTETNLIETAGRVFIDGNAEVSVPQSGLIDFSSIDVILLSNYYNVLALPFVTEYSGFHGSVYATDPTLQIGRLFMEELVAFNESSSKLKKFPLWKSKEIQKFLPYPLCDLTDVASWETIYTAQDVTNCISKIQAVGFDEKVDVLGLLQITAVSSGYTIGSANWLLQTPFHKVSYLSSSSSYATHSKVLDQESMKESDVVITSCLTSSPVHNPDAMIRDFCSNMVVTLKNGGNVLVPCYPSGVIYDLLEYLVQYMDGNGLSFIPIYFISPVADSSLAYANIYGEWLNNSKQAKIYLPEPPFNFQDSVKNGRIKHFKNLHDGLSSSFQSPCMVFTGHPTCRFGDAVHFIDMWGNESGNTIIFIEPEFSYLEVLQPFQPLSMKAVYCPICPRLNFSQANKVLREIKPRKLVAPESYLTPPAHLQQRTDLTLTPDCTILPYRYLDIIDLPLQKEYTKVTLSSEIAEALVLKEIEPGIALASVKGSLVTRDNQHTLKALGGQRRSQVGKHLFGDVDINQFLEALEEEGVKGAQVEDTDSGGHIVHFSDIDAMIQVEQGNTHIINHGGDELRVRIKNALVSCLLQV